jgi:hypothetical protein
MCVHTVMKNQLFYGPCKNDNKISQEKPYFKTPQNIPISTMHGHHYYRQVDGIDLIIYWNLSLLDQACFRTSTQTHL